jgi:hypothetical protein
MFLPVISMASIRPATYRSSEIPIDGVSERLDGEQRGVPLFDCPLLPRPRLTELINRATRRKVALVCGPAGAGKTVACAQWAAAPAGDRQVVWLTWSADEDTSWFWADLVRAREMPHRRVGPRGDGALGISLYHPRRVKPGSS